MKNILFASSEAYPLMKTGGLGDVVGSLPISLHKLGYDVKVIIPAYRDTLAKTESLRSVCQLTLPDIPGLISILETTLAKSKVKVWLVDYPPFFDRPGNPYHDHQGVEWNDNADRFALFCRIIELISIEETGLNWMPDIVHCHDWQTGLVPALLSQYETRPATIFTIHNLAYQGVFHADNFSRLKLPTAIWGVEGVEFYGQLSYMKGGLVFADRLTTVSPSYAEEIQTQEFGYGLAGLLQHRQKDLSGIINGIDTSVWNPATDNNLVAPFHISDLSGKQENKRQLQSRFELEEESDTPLLVLIGRLVEQKGIDIVLDALPSLLSLPMQIVILGTGDKSYETQLLSLSQTYSNLAVLIGFDEKLAHQMEAGGDMFLMPSRFEPCGLNQLYSLRYGTIPIVRPVGGLNDTVIDIDDAETTLPANGFVIEQYSCESLVDTVNKAIITYHDKERWKKMVLAGMEQNFSWAASAQQYAELYEQLT